MKKSRMLLIAGLVFLGACNKTTNNYNVLGLKPAFTLSGVHDVTFTNGLYPNQISLPIAVQYNDSTQNTVSLSVSGLPSGITMDSSWVTSGYPPYSTSLNLFDTSLAGAVPGTYPVIITATGANGTRRAYTFNVKVKAMPPCDGFMLGKYAFCYTSCLGVTYTDSVYADPSISNKVWFSNYGNSGSKVYGNFDCNTGTLIIPSQSLGAYTVSGSFSVTSTPYISGYFNYNGSNCSLTMSK